MGQIYDLCSVFSHLFYKSFSLLSILIIFWWQCNNPTSPDCPIWVRTTETSPVSYSVIVWCLASCHCLDVQSGLGTESGAGQAGVGCTAHSQVLAQRWKLVVLPLDYGVGMRMCDTSGCSGLWLQLGKYEWSCQRMRIIGDGELWSLKWRRHRCCQGG